MNPDTAPLAGPADPDEIRGLRKRWDVSRARSGQSAQNTSLLDRVLSARGITDPATIDELLNPSMQRLHDPSLIPDLDKAAERILTAVQNDEQIVIYGDYDVDGVTGSAVLIHTLRAINPNTRVSSYIPHRVDEGYGINAEALRTIRDQGATLAVSVDCGITAIDEAKAARDLGLDLIITDHHNPPESLDDLPEAFAVVHPRRPDSDYPFGELCGAGVAFKLAWRLATLHCGSDRVTPKLRSTLVSMTALVALGTIADIVPLVDENRVLTRFGLPMVRSTPIEGLAALIDSSGLGSDKIDTEDVGFRLAPRLNAIGRLGHARDALELLTDAQGRRATDLAESLSEMNEQRRATERRIVDQAAKLAVESGMTDNDTRAIVLAHEDWHPGVIGIVCSRLVEKFARPVVLMQRDQDECKGSARSIEGFDIHHALGSCADHLTGFGGHTMAAGMRCAPDRFEEFASAFVEHANSVLSPDDLAQRVVVDVIASVNDLTEQSIKELDALAPFGAGNPRVRVMLESVVLERDPEPFGKTGVHASLRVRDRDDRRTIRVIGWNWFERVNTLRRGAIIDCVVEPSCSSWNGRVSVEPVLSDLRMR